MASNYTFLPEGLKLIYAISVLLKIPKHNIKRFLLYTGTGKRPEGVKALSTVTNFIYIAFFFSSFIFFSSLAFCLLTYWYRSPFHQGSLSILFTHHLCGTVFLLVGSLVSLASRPRE